MSSISTESIITLAIASAIFVLLLNLLFYLFSERKSRKYDIERNRAEIEILRSKFERDIYQLTDRLTATEARWQDVNHLLISSQNNISTSKNEKKSIVYSDFIKLAGINENDLQIENDLVFVLTPFHSIHNETFETIASVCRTIGLRCFRGDEQNIQGDIINHILSMLVRARIVIANIDGRNPNVYYELGIAHAMDKNTILISKSINELPVDIKAKKIIIYKNYSDLQNKLRDELAKSLIAK